VSPCCSRSRAVIRVSRQYRAIFGLGAGRVASLGVDIGQHFFGAGDIAAASDDLVQHLRRAVQVALGDQRRGRVVVGAAGGAGEGRLPLRLLGRIGGDGLAQQFLRRPGLALPQPHQPQPAQGIGIVRVAGQRGLEIRSRLAQLISLQRRKALRARIAFGIGRIDRLWRVGRRHQILHCRVIGIFRQIGLVHRKAAGILRQKGQGLLPGAGGGGCHRRERSQTRQPADPGLAGLRLIGLDTGERQLRLQVAGVGGNQRFEAGNCLRPAIRRARQRLVIFHAVTGWRRAAMEALLIEVYRGCVIAGLGGRTGCRQCIGVDRVLGLMLHLRQRRYSRIAGLQLPQRCQILRRRNRIALRQLDLHPQRQRIGVGRVERQQPPQGVERLLRLVLRLPILRLAQQRRDDRWHAAGLRRCRVARGWIRGLRIGGAGRQQQDAQCEVSQPGL
jgi:hypothetical protein